jgi:hypothetical protein
VGFVNIRVKDTVSATTPNPEMENWKKKKLFEACQAVFLLQKGGIDSTVLCPVLRIRNHMILGLLDPDPLPLVRGVDPDPGSLSKISKKTLDLYCFVTSF